VVASLAFALAAIGCSRDEVVVHVVGDSALAGAEIVIDGALTGRLGAPLGDHCDASIVVTVGDYEIEVRKAGHDTARDFLYFKCCEQYLTLKATSDHEISILGWGRFETRK
jgi:hypothetical protein